MVENQSSIVFITPSCGDFVSRCQKYLGEILLDRTDGGCCENKLRVRARVGMWKVFRVWRMNNNIEICTPGSICDVSNDPNLTQKGKDQGGKSKWQHVTEDGAQKNESVNDYFCNNSLFYPHYNFLSLYPHMKICSIIIKTEVMCLVDDNCHNSQEGIPFTPILSRASDSLVKVDNPTKYLFKHLLHECGGLEEGQILSVVPLNYLILQKSPYEMCH